MFAGSSKSLDEFEGWGEGPGRAETAISPVFRPLPEL